MMTYLGEYVRGVTYLSEYVRGERTSRSVDNDILEERSKYVRGTDIAIRLSRIIYFKLTIFIDTGLGLSLVRD